MIEKNNRNNPKEEEKSINKPKFLSKEWIEEFMIPRNFIDVVFIFICFILAWYALTYDIEAAKVPVICASYWNKWVQEKAGLLGGLDPFNTANYSLTNYTLLNISQENISSMNMTQVVLNLTTPNK